MPTPLKRFFSISLVAFSFLATIGTTFGQARTLDANQLTAPLRVDGNLDESIYENAKSTGSFTERSPTPGLAAQLPTLVWVYYDDEALYVSAKLHDHPDSILSQITGRDGIGNSDWFGVSIAPYKDGINASNFVVTASGGQLDSKFSGNRRSENFANGDRSWDAVWNSAVAKTDDGWSVELKIPFSMLRFPKGNTQYWDINFQRSLARTSQQWYWNPIDPNVQGAAAQMGRIRNLNNINPGPRLQLTPFVALNSSGQTTPNSSNKRNRVLPNGNTISSNLSAGMDLKYGLSEAFTLDMTLIPDFSNARSDDAILNLGPNEQRFGESRTFFVEGTELFTKGGWFYSRRIGGNLYGNSALNLLPEEATVSPLPQRASLLNATKVTGRTRSGLGIGVFNAVEASEHVTVSSPDGRNSQLGVHPLTNYAVFSLDQNLANGSSITLINTATLRAGSAYDANLTGLTWDLRNKRNNYGFTGKTALSQQYNIRSSNEEAPTNNFGHTYEVRAGKIAGALTYSAQYTVESDTYDPNDLGFLGANNERTLRLRTAYNWLKPVGPFNSAGINAGLIKGKLYAPNVHTNLGAWLGARVRTRSLISAGFNGWSNLKSSHDYLDSRTPGRRIIQEPYSQGSFWLSSDYRKRLAVDMRAIYGRGWKAKTQRRYDLRVSPRLRVGDQLTVRVGGNLSNRLRQRGYVGHTEEAVEAFDLASAKTNYNVLDKLASGYEDLSAAAIVLGDRDIKTVELESSVSYAFSPNANLNLRARHYWSDVSYGQFHELGSSGESAATLYTGIDEKGEPIHDQNFNAFNIDCFVQWRFAPGSDALLSYKTQANYSTALASSFLDNLSALGTDPINNTLAVKVIYWLDAGKYLKRRRPQHPTNQDPEERSQGEELLSMQWQNQEGIGS